MMCRRSQTCGPICRAIEAELLVQLATQRGLVVLTRLLATARCRPHRDGGELEADQQDAVVRIEEDSSDRRPDPQLVGHHPQSSGLSGSPSLNARYIS